MKSPAGKALLEPYFQDLRNLVGTSSDVGSLPKRLLLGTGSIARNVPLQTLADQIEGAPHYLEMPFKLVDEKLSHYAKNVWPLLFLHPFTAGIASYHANREAAALEEGEYLVDLTKKYQKMAADALRGMTNKDAEEYLDRLLTSPKVGVVEKSLYNVLMSAPYLVEAIFTDKIIPQVAGTMVGAKAGPQAAKLIQAGAAVPSRYLGWALFAGAEKTAAKRTIEAYLKNSGVEITPEIEQIAEQEAERYGMAAGSVMYLGLALATHLAHSAIMSGAKSLSERELLARALKNSPKLWKYFGLTAADMGAMGTASGFNQYLENKTLERVYSRIEKELGLKLSLPELPDPKEVGAVASLTGMWFLPLHLTGYVRAKKARMALQQKVRENVAAKRNLTEGVRQEVYRAEHRIKQLEQKVDRTAAEEHELRILKGGVAATLEAAALLEKNAQASEGVKRIPFEKQERSKQRGRLQPPEQLTVELPIVEEDMPGERRPPTRSEMGLLRKAYERAPKDFVRWAYDLLGLEEPVSTKTLFNKLANHPFIPKRGKLSLEKITSPEKLLEWRNADSLPGLLITKGEAKPLTEGTSIAAGYQTGENFVPKNVTRVMIDNSQPLPAPLSVLREMFPKATFTLKYPELPVYEPGNNVSRIRGALLPSFKGNGFRGGRKGNLFAYTLPNGEVRTAHISDLIDVDPDAGVLYLARTEQVRSKERGSRIWKENRGKYVNYELPPAQRTVTFEVEKLPKNISSILRKTTGEVKVGMIQEGKVRLPDDPNVLRQFKLQLELDGSPEAEKLYYKVHDHLREAEPKSFAKPFPSEELTPAERESLHEKAHLVTEERVGHLVAQEPVGDLRKAMEKFMHEIPTRIPSDPKKRNVFFANLYIAFASLRALPTRIRSQIKDFIMEVPKEGGFTVTYDEKLRGFVINLGGLLHEKVVSFRAVGWPMFHEGGHIYSWGFKGSVINKHLKVEKGKFYPSEQLLSEAGLRLIDRFNRWLTGWAHFGESLFKEEWEGNEAFRKYMADYHEVFANLFATAYDYSSALLNILSNEKAPSKAFNDYLHNLFLQSARMKMEWAEDMKRIIGSDLTAAFYGDLFSAVDRLLDEDIMRHMDIRPGDSSEKPRTFFSRKPPDELRTKKQSGYIHVLEERLNLSAEKRAELKKMVSGGRTDSSADFTVEEATRYLDILESMMQKKVASTIEAPADRRIAREKRKKSVTENKPITQRTNREMLDLLNPDEYNSGAAKEYLGKLFTNIEKPTPGKPVEISEMTDLHTALSAAEEKTGFTVPLGRKYVIVMRTFRNILSHATAVMETLFEDLPFDMSHLLVKASREKAVYDYLAKGTLPEGLLPEVYDFYKTSKGTLSVKEILKSVRNKHGKHVERALAYVILGERVRAAFANYERFVKFMRHSRWINDGILPPDATEAQMREGQQILETLGQEAYTRWLDESDFGVREIYLGPEQRGEMLNMRNLYKAGVFGRSFTFTRESEAIPEYDPEHPLMGALFRYMLKADSIRYLEKDLWEMQKMLEENSDIINGAPMEIFFDRMFMRLGHLPTMQRRMAGAMRTFFRVLLPQRLIAWSVRNLGQPLFITLPKIAHPLDPLFWKHFTKLIISTKRGYDADLMNEFSTQISSLDGYRKQFLFQELSDLTSSSLRLEESGPQIRKLLYNTWRELMRLGDAAGHLYALTDLANRFRTFSYGYFAGLDAGARYLKEPTFRNLRRYMEVTGAIFAPKMDQAMIVWFLEHGEVEAAARTAAEYLTASTQFRYPIVERGLAWQHPQSALYYFFPLVTFFRGEVQNLYYSGLKPVGELVTLGMQGKANKLHVIRGINGMRHLLATYMAGQLARELWRRFFHARRGSYGLDALTYRPGAVVFESVMNIADVWEKFVQNDPGAGKFAVHVLDSLGILFVPLYLMLTKALLQPEWTNPKYQSGHKLTKIRKDLYPMKKLLEVMNHYLEKKYGLTTIQERERWVDMTAWGVVNYVFLGGNWNVQKRDLAETYFTEYLGAKTPEEFEKAKKKLLMQLRLYPVGAKKKELPRNIESIYLIAPDLDEIRRREIERSRLPWLYQKWDERFR